MIKTLLNPWLLLALVVILLLAFGVGYWKGSKDGDVACTAKSVKTQNTEIKKADQESTRREAVGAARETSREQIRIVYRAIKEKADAVLNKQGSDESHPDSCSLDADGLRIWNSANTGSTATLPSEPDYRLPSTAASSVGEAGGFAGQPHRGDGAGGAVSRPAEQAGGMFEGQP